MPRFASPDAEIRLTQALTSHSESRTGAFRMVRDMARSTVLFAYECELAKRKRPLGSPLPRELGGEADKTGVGGAHGMTADGAIHTANISAFLTASRHRFPAFFDYIAAEEALARQQVRS